MILSQTETEVTTLHSIGAGLAVVNVAIKFPLLQQQSISLPHAINAIQINTIKTKTDILAK